MCILRKVKRFVRETKAEIKDIIYIVKTELDFEFNFEDSDKDLQENKHK
jgi:hypothetical protein